jgi:hypothetical protein
MTEEVNVPESSAGKPQEQASEETPPVVPRVNYENIRTALKIEREKRRKAEDALRSNPKPEEDYEEEGQEAEKELLAVRKELEAVKAYTEVQKLVVSDPFVRDNLADIQEVMENNPMLTARQASDFLKARAIDHLYQGKNEVESVYPKVIIPKTTEVPSSPKESEDPMMENAIRAVI